MPIIFCDFPKCGMSVSTPLQTYAHEACGLNWRNASSFTFLASKYEGHLNQDLTKSQQWSGQLDKTEQFPIGKLEIPMWPKLTNKVKKITSHLVLGRYKFDFLAARTSDRIQGELYRCVHLTLDEQRKHRNTVGKDWITVNQNAPYHFCKPYMYHLDTF